MKKDIPKKIESIPLEVLLKDGKISQETYQKVISAKKYIERKYNLIQLKQVENNILYEKLKTSGLPQKKRLEILEEIQEKERFNIRKKLEKMSAKNYESLSIIGRGSFGEIHVCRNIKTGEIVAIKIINKDILIKKNQLKYTLDEQDFLSKVNSPWIVKLKASFQEGDYLYLVMEYLPGGDLKELFITKDILTEEEARFYICEMILAIESIHELNCIHRDIKPENVLIGKDGHIKLTDFGLAKISDNVFKEDIIDYKYDAKRVKHNKNYSFVGTANYVAPEVMLKQGYKQEIDWWSLGVILFEMITGYTPFCSKNTQDLCQKMMHLDKYLKFPEKCKVSEECKDLIYKLLNTSDIRLGKKGSAEIKAHPFFKGVNWLKIREMKPPFIPEIENDYDVKYFEDNDYIEPFIPPEETVVRKRKEPEYIGYEFKGEETDPTDILSIIDMIKQKKLEVEKEKEKLNKGLIKMDSHENEKTEDSSNYNSNNNNIKEMKEEKDIKCIRKKIHNFHSSYIIGKKKTEANPGIQKQNSINKINLINSISKNTVLKFYKSEKGGGKKTEKEIPAKNTLMQNVGNSLKKLFSRTTIKKKEIKIK